MDVTVYAFFLMADVMYIMFVKQCARSKININDVKRYMSPRLNLHVISTIHKLEKMDGIDTLSVISFEIIPLIYESAQNDKTNSALSSINNNKVSSSKHKHSHYNKL